jgi:hypothetical protein
VGPRVLRCPALCATRSWLPAVECHAPFWLGGGDFETGAGWRMVTRDTTTIVEFATEIAMSKRRHCRSRRDIRIIRNTHTPGPCRTTGCHSLRSYWPTS